MKNILDIVDIGHQLCITATAHSLERDFPFAHWESILLLSFDRVLDCDDLFEENLKEERVDQEWWLDSIM